MSDYDKLVEALENTDGDLYLLMLGEGDKDLARMQHVIREALPLARQLIEENERLKLQLFNAGKGWKTRMADLEARLSAAETGARENHEAWSMKYRALQARLSAAEKENDRLQKLAAADEVILSDKDLDIADLQTRLSAAEDTIRERDDEIADLRGGA